MCGFKRLSGAGSPENGYGAQRPIVVCVISFIGWVGKTAVGIQGELLMLGVEVAQSTVSKYLTAGWDLAIKSDLGSTIGL
jgi:hypothetical protein